MKTNKRKNISLVIIVLLCVIVDGYGQSLLHHPEAYFIPPPGSEKYFYDLQKVEDNRSYEPRIQYHLDIGTSFIGTGGYGSGLNTYLSPSVRYRLLPKFDIEVGGTIIYSSPRSVNPSTLPSGFSEAESSNASYYLYARGVYRVSDRLNIDGVFMKSSGKNYIPYSYPVNHNFEYYSLGLNYRLSDAFRIGAQFNFMNGTNPGYYQDPYSGRSSLYYHPFIPSYTGW
ncbi:MAG: hypothetical protein JSV24_07930 [Bacteroidales bacterium]|nr:MAG: hypothetical protein JSV24_07930 [Bacteroidales bacterium]